MADVIEVIHQINYEVNDAALQNATAAIKAQIAELNSLNNALKGYQQQLSNTRNITALDDLSRKIDTVSKQIEASVGKAKGIMEQFGSGIIKGLGLDTSIEGAVEKFFKPLGDHLFKVKEGGDGAGGAIKGIAGLLGNFSQFAPGAISLVLSLATELYGMATAASEAETAYKNYQNRVNNTVEEGRKSIRQRREELQLEQDLISRSGPKNRRALIDEYKEKHDRYFEKLTDEQILDGSATKYLQDRMADTETIKAGKAVISHHRDEQEVLRQRRKQTEAQLLVAEKELSNAKKQIYTANRENTIVDFEKKVKDLKTQIDSFTFLINGIDSSIAAAIVDGAKLTPLREVKKPAVSDKPFRYGGSKKISSDNRNSDPPPLNYKFGIPEYDDDSLYRPVPSAIKQDMITSFPKVEEKADTTYKPSKLEKLLFGDTANEQNAQKRRREEIKKSIDAYQTLATTAAQAFQDIYAAQVKALDAEIEIRKKRVDAAMKLAERGNTEALRIEEEKLKEAEKKREEYARKQQIINSALAVSNAVVAVASAASQSGAGALVIVPAVIAAIIAGYAAISAATKESSAQAFADGVVGFRGKGGPRDDANWVRISSGESVITATGTGANRHVLEAINKGAQFRVVDPRIHAAMPVLKAPDMNGGNTNYASQQSMKNLEDKLDGVINAIEQNSFKQDVFFNEQGVGMLTERAVKRNNRRFK